MTPVKEPLTIIPKGGTAINNKGEVIATGAPDIDLDPLTKLMQNRQIAFKNRFRMNVRKIIIT
jgi:hypothetical protein